MDSGWKGKVLLIGGLIGAFTGLGAAYLIISKSQEHDEPPKIGAGDGVRLGLLLLGLVRQIGELGAGQEE
ncbi:MAG TPA: hypothetical protein VI520_00835 [Anaerolineales bacterium]|jgi:hypothetical protein|nr:hypothetical protein [Anaerolineales bacterium]